MLVTNIVELRHSYVKAVGTVRPGRYLECHKPLMGGCTVLHGRAAAGRAYALTHCHSPALTHVLNHKSKQYRWDFPDGPVVKNLSSNAAPKLSRFSRVRLCATP